MSAVPRIAIGAPGIYRDVRTARPPLAGERMDICAFVGVSPRGPARVAKEPEAFAHDRALVGAGIERRRSVAVPVESWEEYRRLFGGFEGPGRLPYAVSLFFEQGGRKAYIVRIVHAYTGVDADRNHQGAARGLLLNAVSSTGTLYLDARSEGTWGNDLRAVMGYSVTSLDLLPASSTDELLVAPDENISVGTAFVLSVKVAGVMTREVRFAERVRRRGLDNTGDEVLVVTLNASAGNVPERAAVLEGDLLISDGAGTEEHFSHIGLSSSHPRWMATVLYNESRLVYPHETWIDGRIEPEDPDRLPFVPRLDGEDVTLFTNGEDRYVDIDFDDFFDTGWTLGDPEPGDGVHALTHLAELSTLVVPDLYVPESLVEAEDVTDTLSLAGAEFAPCVDLEAVPEAESVSIEQKLQGLLLFPNDPGDLETITKLQERLAAFVDSLRAFVVLLDVPPGLSQSRIRRWRARFRSSYVAAYFPWIKVSLSDDRRDRLMMVNPSAAAAGIIARQETLFGVPYGPANVIVAGAVQVDERISPARHDELHPLGINIYLQERDGVWLSAARTLSRDRRYRQLSVRRLMLMLRRALERQMQWAVFEPNDPKLWFDVRLMLQNFLRRLYAQGAFRGASENEAFFVRCDEQLNTRRVIDAGQMIAEIGVAPAEPLEFIVVRLTRGGDGTLAVES